MGFDAVKFGRNLQTFGRSHYLLLRVEELSRPVKACEGIETEGRRRFCEGDYGVLFEHDNVRLKH
jgi:hypothetical protein